MASSSDKAVHAGLFIARFGIGALYVAFGLPLLQAGSDTWRQLGAEAVEPIGITFGHVGWGVIGVGIYAVCGLFLAVGVLVRPSALALLATAALTAYGHLHANDSFEAYSTPLAMAILFVAFVISGGGDYALGRAIKPLDGKWYQ